MTRLAAFLLLTTTAGLSLAQALPQPTQVWSVGPLTKSEPVMGITFGGNGASLTGTHPDSQTSSIFSATRSVVFVGDRIILKSDPAPYGSQQLFSLDIHTGIAKDSREFKGFGMRGIFATSDSHLIAPGTSVILRLTPELKDEKSMDVSATSHSYFNVQNVSPDGSTLGNRASPDFQLIGTLTLKLSTLPSKGLVDTSINDHGVITDNVHWIRDYPKDRSFVTYYDAAGDHLLYHGKCGGRPQFLTNTLILEPGCKSPLIIDTQGNLVKTIPTKGEFSYAGVSQNGKRFALQIASFSGMHDLRKEKFVIYNMDTWEPITEVTPDAPAQEQSWTAFSPDGSMFVVGSPVKLTLYRLP